MLAIDESLVPAVPRPDIAARLAGLVTVLLWGSAFVAIRAVGETMSPGALAFGRVLVSSAVLNAIALVRREPLPGRRDLVRIGAYGVLFQGVYSVALNEAERRVDAGTAAMLIASGPLLIAVLAGILLREGFPRWLFAGCAVAFVGSSIIGFATSQSGSRAGLGIVLLLVAVLAYAAAVVVQKSALTRASAFQVTWLGCLAAAVALLPYAPSLIRDVQHAGPTAIGWIVYLGIFPTALGFATWTFALRRTSAGRMGAMIYLIPPMAILLGWAILGETPPWLAVAGGALCLAGVYLARRD
jgi:drug/metabolite transporter (DMT)-like permease